MACPFFKVAYVGYCNANESPYTPSINELEQQCFKDSFESCINFNKVHSTARIVAHQSGAMFLKEAATSIR
jgi:hypothetical protein